MIRKLKQSISSVTEWLNASVGMVRQARLPELRGPNDDQRHLLYAIVTAVCSALVFFLPSLLNNSLNAGYIYTGDVLNGYLPYSQKLGDLVRHGALTGIDYSTHGGASDFFLRANLWGYNPVMIIMNLAGNPKTTEQMIRLLVVCLFLYSMAAVFFTYRLADRYLGLGSAAAVFISVGYVFSVNAVYALGEPSFLLSAWMMPAVVYAALSFRDKPSLIALIFAPIPTYLVLTSGYAPLGAASLLFAFILCLGLNFLKHEPGKPVRAKVVGALLSIVPLMIGSLVVLPLFLDYLRYNGLVRSAPVGIFFAAFQLAETPKSILRSISTYFTVPGPFYELTPVFGMIPIVIGLLYFFGMGKKEKAPEFGRMLLFVAVVYFFVFFAIYGDYSVVSDLVYQIPFVGGMHIYQRHLLAGHFFFIMAVAMMLKVVAGREIQVSHKVMLGAAFLIVAIALFVLNFNAALASSISLNESVLLDLLFALVFLGVLFYRVEKVAYLIATFLIMLDPLNVLYNYSSTPDYNYEVQRTQAITLDKDYSKQLLAYFRANCDKQIVKYVDLVSGPPNAFPINYISPNYPWFVSKQMALSSYGGYDFHVSVRKSYTEAMPYQYIDNRWRMHPDWKWLGKTGADFVIYDAGYESKDKGLLEYADLSNPARVFRLPNGLIVAPLKITEPAFDRTDLTGRYVRVQLEKKDFLSIAELKVNGLVDGKVVNVALNKPATQSSNITITGLAPVAVDGNTDGDWDHGSVTHSKNDDHSWLQVDLGDQYRLDSVELWNRTDSNVGNRLSDFWVFVSDTPFASGDDFAELTKNPRVAKAHILSAPNPNVVVWGGSPGGAGRAAAYDNGYLRIMGAKADVTVRDFKTNTASTMELRVNNKNEVRVDYLFWPNEHLQYFINGKRLYPTNINGLDGVSLPAGENRLEILYKSKPADFFVFVSICYLIVIMGTGIYLLAQRGRVIIKGMRRGR